MPSRELSYPVFDADNHFYEPKEALTQFLPDHRKGVIDYIDVRGRTKIMVRNVVSDYIPNPTFEVVARPGAQEEYFRHGSVQMHDLLGEVQSDPRAGYSGSRTGPVISVEDLRQLVCGDPDAPVADRAIGTGAVHPDLDFDDRRMPEYLMAFESRFTTTCSISMLSQ